jgi:hypothetical protein
MVPLKKRCLHGNRNMVAKRSGGSHFILQMHASISAELLFAKGIVCVRLCRSVCYSRDMFGPEREVMPSGDSMMSSFTGCVYGG